MSEQPQPENFGVTPEQVAAYCSHDPKQLAPLRSTLLWFSACVVAILVITFTPVSSLLFINEGYVWLKLPIVLLLVAAYTWGLIVSVTLAAYAFRGIVWLFGSRSARLPQVPRSRVKAYLCAKTEYEKAVKQVELEQKRSQEEYWHSLSGQDFETELARLYKLAGYTVETTSVTGDEGVDLFLRKDNQLSVVQCKRHNKRLGPVTVRELHGTLLHFRADCGILAATGGFTDGARRHAHGKPIELLDLDGILSLQEERTQPK
jgi:hypothetical protein